MEGGAAGAHVADSSVSEHFVQFYERDAFLEDAVADFIGGALRDGGAGIVVATTAHREALEQRLRMSGFDLDAGRYIALDAAETLSRFMTDGAPDPGVFENVIGARIDRAAEGGRRVRVFGEMVALLAVAGNTQATLQLEELWNRLQSRRSFALFCAYPMDRLGGETLAELLSGVCVQHARVTPAESYTELGSADDRLRAVAALQQKACWLEREVAARRQAEERLSDALAAERDAREAAESALRLRDEFLSVAAHELRTPLTSLSGHAQLLLRLLERHEDLEPERVALAMQTITRQAGKLSRLLGQLMDISRLESGKLQLDRHPTDMAALAGQVVEGARAISDRHSITLTATPLHVNVDPLRIEQVLANLLDNAIKYSPDGGPIDVVLQRTSGSTVELSVRDRGLGIPPEKRGQIFERFCQAHDNVQQSGLGLGLFISRQIVELHGGEIRAEFPADGGTRFVVRLLTGADQPAAGAPEPLAPLSAE
jgi:signal transduction histidine kinase